MAKIRVTVPVLGFRKQVVETPPTKAQLVKRALSAQQDQLTGRMAKKGNSAGPDDIHIHPGEPVPRHGAAEPTES